MPQTPQDQSLQDPPPPTPDTDALTACTLSTLNAALQHAQRQSGAAQAWLLLDLLRPAVAFTDPAGAAAPTQREQVRRRGVQMGADALWRACLRKLPEPQRQDFELLRLTHRTFLGLPVTAANGLILGAPLVGLALLNATGAGDVHPMWGSPLICAIWELRVRAFNRAVQAAEDRQAVHRPG